MTPSGRHRIFIFALFVLSCIPATSYAFLDLWKFGQSLFTINVTTTEEACEMYRVTLGGKRVKECSEITEQRELDPQTIIACYRFSDRHWLRIKCLEEAPNDAYKVYLCSKFSSRYVSSLKFACLNSQFNYSAISACLEKNSYGLQESCLHPFTSR